MNHKILLLVNSLLFSLVIFSSCKKDTDSKDNTFSDCRLIEMSNPEVEMTVEISYNSENKISKMFNTGNLSYVDMIYGDSTITSITYKQGKETSRTVIYLNKAGKEIKNIRDESQDDAFYTDTTYYSYDPDGYCIQALHHAKSISGPSQRVLLYSYAYKYVISDGNVIKLTEESVPPFSTAKINRESTYEYYAGIENKSRIDENGRLKINVWSKANKNPVKKMTTMQEGKAPTSETFYYKYNANGYVTEISKSINDDSPVVDLNFSYECR